MSHKQPLPHGERGAAMLAALCLAMVFAIALSSYVAMCYVSLIASTRNGVSGHCMEIAEAGIEQALYTEQNSAWSSPTWTVSGAIATASLTMTASGLVSSSSSPTPLNLGNGAIGTVNITVNNYASSAPSIISQGVVTLPLGSTTVGTKPTISRTLTFNAGTSGSTAAPVFVNAVAATTGRVIFDFAGTLDSYNSNPSAGVFQTYLLAPHGYSAVVASGDVTSGSPTVCLNAAVVNGYAVGYDCNSPSTTNWLSYGTSGKLIGPNTPNATYIDSSRILTSPVAYQPVFPEITPFPSASSLPSAFTSGGNQLNRALAPMGIAGATIPTYYSAGGGANLATTLTVQGPVVIFSYSAFTIGPGGGIVLSGPTASLQIFQEYGDIDIAGNGITNTNAYPLPKKVAILSTNNASFTVRISTANDFYGIIYFPYEAVTVTSSLNIYGSIVGSSVTFNGGNPAIHYDNALRAPDTNVCNPAFANIMAPVTVGSLLASVP
jgi:hypothetical protein